MGHGMMSARRWLEKIGIIPAGFAAVGSFMLRSAQYFSFNGFSIARLPWGLPALFDMLTGIGIAFACEILGSAGMGKWWTYFNERAEVGSRVGLTKAAKAALRAKLTVKCWLHFIYGILGYAATVWAGVSVATARGATNVSADIVLMVIAVLAVSYIFVFWEPEEEHPLAATVAQAKVAVKATMKGIGDAIQAGTHTPRQVRALQTALIRGNARDEADMLDPLIEHEAQIRYYSPPEIARMIGRDDEAGLRDVRRMVAAHVNDDMQGMPAIKRRTNGRGWEVPATMLGLLFGDEIAELAKSVEKHRVTATRWYLAAQAGQPPAPDRQSAASAPVEFQPAGPFIGQTPDNERTNLA